MKNKIEGRAHKFGNDINTDYIIAGKYTKTLDYNSLAEHIFEDIAPDFRKTMNSGDFIVAGRNFGCGSSREQAPIAIKCAGVGAVLAKSFSRIFFRNSINIGIPVLICDTDNIKEGDKLEINIQANMVHNLTKDILIRSEPLSLIMINILEHGGLVNFLKKYGDFVI